MNTANKMSENDRLRYVGIFLIFCGLIFAIRLFYLQVIKGAEYRLAADQSQTKSLEIEAKRGRIYAYSGDQQVPLVLNERRWLLFADAQFIDDIPELGESLSFLGISLTQEQRNRLESGSRYVVIATDLTDQNKQTLEDRAIRGLYFQERSARSYTEGSLAAHVLGFVNRDGVGQYGAEEHYKDALTGVPGQLKAITDSTGVPLAFEENNIATEPQDGKDVVLTIDVGIQKIAEKALTSGVESTNAIGGSVMIMDAQTGAIRAMANYPTFTPAEYEKANISDYTNKVLSDAIEPGSVMKPLVVAAALDKDVVGMDYTYFDEGGVILDGEEVRNSREYGAQQRNLEEILTFSLNTGSIELLKLLGGGQVNEQARTALYDYYSDVFGLGQQTGIDLQNEAVGRLFGPNEGFGLNIRYGNMTFGQGLSVTLPQIARSYAVLLNGGNQVQPYVIDSIGGAKTEPTIQKSNLLKQSTLAEINNLMRSMGATNYPDVQVPGLEISGKTGTAQIPTADGSYLEGRFIGTFAGYVKNQDEALVIVVRIDQPEVQYTSLQGSAPIWKEIVRGLVNTGKVN